MDNKNNVLNYDLEVDETGDLIFRNGDLSIYVSNDEHAKAILESQLGEWKQSPSTGCGLKTYLNASVLPASLKQNIEKQFNNDGFNIIDLDVQSISGDLIVNINAKRFK